MKGAARLALALSLAAHAVALTLPLPRREAVLRLARIRLISLAEPAPRKPAANPTVEPRGEDMPAAEPAPPPTAPDPPRRGSPPAPAAASPAAGNQEEEGKAAAALRGAPVPAEAVAESGEAQPEAGAPRDVVAVAEPARATAPGGPAPGGESGGAGAMPGAGKVPDLVLRSARAGGGEGAHPGDGELLALIRRRILAARAYPALARKRGWEGRTRVGFTIGEGGQAGEVELLESSGNRVLDQASVRAVREAAPYPFYRGRIEVPITFELGEGGPAADPLFSRAGGGGQGER